MNVFDVVGLVLAAGVFCVGTCGFMYVSERRARK